MRPHVTSRRRDARLLFRFGNRNEGAESLLAHRQSLTPAPAAQAPRRAVRKALVVDITRQNPNVLYELGFAHALRKPSILISSSEVNSSPPSDLAGFQYIVYEPNHLRGLANGVQRAARVFVDRVDEQK
jgi:hypothetical protein